MELNNLENEINYEISKIKKSIIKRLSLKKQYELKDLESILSDINASKDINEVVIKIEKQIFDYQCWIKLGEMETENRRYLDYEFYLIEKTRLKLEKHSLKVMFYWYGRIHFLVSQMH